jgi:hypothetical protein
MHEDRIATMLASCSPASLTMPAFGKVSLHDVTEKLYFVTSCYQS